MLKTGLKAAEIDADLERLAALWPSIPDNIRQRIVGMAEAFAPPTSGEAR